MKKYILTLILGFFTFISVGQTVYSWTAGVNPGWISTNVGSGNNLTWNTGGSCGGGVVTTDCGGNYSNNQNTSYTSPIINTTCNNASTTIISFFISGNAEYLYDFLFLEYSINGGTTWINPYGINVGWTGNFASLTSISNVITKYIR